MKKTLLLVIKKRFLSLILALSLVLPLCVFSTAKASALDTSYINKEGMNLGYSIINGYTKLSLKHKKNNKPVSTAVYVGLDITNPIIALYAGIFYMNNSIDLNRLATDNSYALNELLSLNNFLDNMGVKNSRSKQFEKTYLKNVQPTTKLSTLGLYIFDATDKETLSLIEYKNVDFVMTGGKVPKSMKDFNFDGKSNSEDKAYMLNYLCKLKVYKDSDEDAYAQFACDVNEDKKIDINDITKLIK